MDVDLIFYITKYGYLAIFLFVFLQEIGAPNPIPNELLLLSSGYMIFLGLLKFPLVLLTAVLADFTATTILHTVFYFSGAYIVQSKPRWVPISVKTIQKLKQQVSVRGVRAIYIGRLTPFIRGYTSVIAGLLQIKSTIFIPIALITASIWAAIYVIAGILLGPFWDHVTDSVKDIRWILFSILIIILIITVFRYMTKLSTRKSGK
jgi:membrane protein DedA with SNARE-associated domain